MLKQVFIYVLNPGIKSQKPDCKGHICLPVINPD